MNPSAPCEKPSEKQTLDLTGVQLDAHTGISSIAQQLLDIGAKVWAEAEEQYGKITPMHHREIERRVDEGLRKKFPDSKWHPNFAGMIGGYTEMVEGHLQGVKK
jgi:hypothetical protein